MDDANKPQTNKLPENSVHENNPEGPRLWLDDYRPAPEGWDLAKTYSEAISLMSQKQYVEVSLDHDLADWHYTSMQESGGMDHDFSRGRQEKTGYHVALWMVEQGYFPQRVTVHSMNPVGAEQMVKLLQRYHPGGQSSVGRGPARR